MNKLIAKKENDLIAELIEVIKQDNEIKVLSDGEENSYLKYHLEFEGENLPVGGTYYPETNTLLFFYNVLTKLEYDVKIIGELEQIPYEEGFIY